LTDEELGGFLVLTQFFQYPNLIDFRWPYLPRAAGKTGVVGAAELTRC
jgi:hypothetical protein